MVIEDDASTAGAPGRQRDIEEQGRLARSGRAAGEASAPQVREQDPPPAIAWWILAGVAAAAGALLVSELAPLCVDDDYRTFWAWWWWHHPSFYPFPHWPPGYFWVYGIVTGVTGDLLLAPRLLSLALHVALIAPLRWSLALPEDERLVAAVWLMLSPLPLVLGAVPLSETLFAALAVGGVIALGSYLSSGRAAWLLASAALYLGAATVRFEGWALLPLFTGLSCLRRPHDAKPAIAWVLRGLPWVFPLAWILLMWGVEADPLLFMKNVATDSFGRGSLTGALASPRDWMTPVQVLGGLAAAGWAVREAARRRLDVRDLVWEAHLVAALAVVAWAVISGNVPSQFTLRLLLLPVIFSAVPAARLLVSFSPRTLRTSVLLAALLLAGTLALAAHREPGWDPDSHEAAEYVRDARDGGVLGPEDRVLVEMDNPWTSAVFVYANDPRRVHIDLTKESAWFESCDMNVPRWASRTRLAVVRSDPYLYRLDLLGWKQVLRTDTWVVYQRTDLSTPLGSCPR